MTSVRDVHCVQGASVNLLQHVCLLHCLHGFQLHQEQLSFPLRFLVLLRNAIILHRSNMKPPPTT